MSTRYTDSPDGTRVIPPTEHAPGVIAWLVGEKYPPRDTRQVPCSVPECTSTTTTARPPWADIVATCSRAHMQQRQQTVRECVCGRAAMRVTAPTRLPPVCSQECTDMFARCFRRNIA